MKDEPKVTWADALASLQKLRLTMDVVEAKLRMMDAGAAGADPFDVFREMFSKKP